MIPAFAVSALSALSTPLAQEPTFWMPVQASEGGATTDWLFRFLFYLSAFFFALIVGLMVLFVVRHRRRAPDELGQGPSHNTALEIIWTAIPLALVIFIFAVGFRGFMHMFGPAGAANAVEIQVTGQKWKWQFTYPNGHVDENLHVPVDTPVQLTMTSEDVIHSFYVPVFRIKKDAVPGRYTKMFFRAVQPGDYVAFCAEYCGTSHSQMLARVIVHPPGEYEKWLTDAANVLDRLAPAEAGAQLFKVRGCLSCHSVDGSPLIGPSVKGVFGHEQILADGSKVVADENYIRESILNPQAKVVAGYDPVMPTYQGRIKDREITAVIEYLKTLK